MKDNQIIQEMNLNLNHQIPEMGLKGLYKVVDFLYGGCYDEVYSELSHKEEKKNA